MLPYTHTFMSSQVTRVDKHAALWKNEGKKQALHAPTHGLYYFFCNEIGVYIR